MTIQRISIKARFCLATVALAVAVLTPVSASAQDSDDESKMEEGLYNCGKAKGQVSVSFKPDVELKDMITWAMGFTCKNFVYSSGIGGRSAKVTIIAPKKMSSRQAWQVFLVALQTMNLTVVPQGNVLRVVESAQAKTEPLPVYSKGNPGATSQLVRSVIRPEHLPAADLATALSALKSKEGAISTVPSANIVVVTDYGAIISKMNTLVREIDQPTDGDRLYMIRVVHADATELAQKLTDILGAKGAGTPSPTPTTTRRNRRDTNSEPTPKGKDSASSDAIATAVPTKIIPDERTNSLVVLASEPAYLRVRALVKRLDVPIGGEGAGRIHVYPLENADAEEMATTLTAVISGISQPSGGTTRTTRPRSDRATAGSGGGGGAAGGSPAFEGQVRVTHDKPTNSLVVIASVKDFLSLRDVIRKLDTPRMQVFIEAVILEVKADNSRDLGASFHAGKLLDDGSLALGGLQHANLQSILPSSLAGSQGLLGGILGPLLQTEEFLGVSVPSFGLLFQALATSSDVNVLSSPHILTTNNEEAEISVGENIPYQSSFSNVGLGGGTGGTGGFGFPVQSVQRQDVALTLKITPHINASDMVRLEIEQEISDIASPNFEGLGPSWAKRTIKTTVVVRDQQSIVIGGLLSDRETYTESKIPLLGDVPVLGYLFKYSQKSKAKTNLLVLLTPYVIKDQMDIEQILQRKIRERQEFIRSFSNFDRIGFEAKIDYRRKRGLIEEINRSVQMVEREGEMLRQMEMHNEVMPDGAIEYTPSGDGGGSGGGGGDDGDSDDDDSDSDDKSDEKLDSSVPGDQGGDSADKTSGKTSAEAG